MTHQTSVPAEAMAVVVVNFGSHQLLESALTVQQQVTDGLVRVLVVDNFSTAAELTAIRALAADRDWLLVESPTNLGFGGAVNLGVRTAAATGFGSVLLLNPDALITGEVATALRLACLADPRALIAPTIVNPDGSSYFHGSEVGLKSGRIRSLGLTEPAAAGEPAVFSRLTEPASQWITGACVAFSTTFFTEIGGYDDSFFMYWEDVDLSYRALGAGGSLLIRHDLQVVHDEGGTQGPQKGRARSGLYYYYNTRNRLLFAARNLPRRTVLRWMLRTPAVSWEILMRGGRRQLIESPVPLWSAVKGSVAGLGRASLSLVHRPEIRPAGTPSLLLAHPSSELYGADRVFLETVSAVVDRGADVTVTLPVDGPLVTEIEARGATVVLCRTPVLQKSALRPAGFVKLLKTAALSVRPALRLIRSAGADGVYVSTITVPAWLVLARLAGKRVTLHVHEAERNAPAVIRRVMALPAALAHSVVANSQFSLETLAGPKSRTRRRSTVVYNGVVGPPSVTLARVESATPVRLLFVGRLSPRKGPQFALQVLDELLSRGVDAELDLLGSVYTGYEWFEAELRATAAAPALRDRVHFLGFENDVWPRIQATDVVVIPSLIDEPFGNTAVEAILAARPLVASRTSGLREAAGGYPSAQVVEPGEVGLWADAVQRIITDWPLFRETAGSDAVAAQRKHSVQAYRDQVATIVLGEPA